MYPLLLLVLMGAEPEVTSALEGVTCGQASVFYVLDRLNTPVPLEEVQKVLPEGKDSMNSFAELQTALGHFGYPDSAGYDLTSEQLMQVRGPVIAAIHRHNIKNEIIDHFVVAERQGSKLLVLDSVEHPRVINSKALTVDHKKVRVLVPSPSNQVKQLKSQKGRAYASISRRKP